MFSWQVRSFPDVKYSKSRKVHQCSIRSRKCWEYSSWLILKFNFLQLKHTIVVHIVFVLVNCLVVHQPNCVYHHQFTDTRWRCRVLTTDYGLWLWSCNLYGTSLQYGICTNHVINLFNLKHLHIKTRLYSKVFILQWFWKY